MTALKLRRPPPRDAGGDLQSDQLGGDRALTTAKIFASQLKSYAAFIARPDRAALAALAFLVIGRRP